jgi:hypothetical protein
MTKDTRSRIILMTVLILGVLVFTDIGIEFDPMKAWMLTHHSSPQYFPTTTLYPTIEMPCFARILLKTQSILRKYDVLYTVSPAELDTYVWTINCD